MRGCKNRISNTFEYTYREIVVHIKKGTMQIIGNIGKRFAQGIVAGAYMKKGTLLAEDPGGHVGADIMRYNKYEAGEEGKYVTIKLRDGSLVRRPVD